VSPKVLSEHAGRTQIVGAAVVKASSKRDIRCKFIFDFCTYSQCFQLRAQHALVFELPPFATGPKAGRPAGDLSTADRGANYVRNGIDHIDGVIFLPIEGWLIAHEQLAKILDHDGIGDTVIGASVEGVRLEQNAVAREGPVATVERVGFGPAPPHRE